MNLLLWECIAACSTRYSLAIGITWRLLSATITRYVMYYLSKYQRTITKDLIKMSMYQYMKWYLCLWCCESKFGCYMLLLTLFQILQQSQYRWLELCLLCLWERARVQIKSHNRHQLQVMTHSISSAINHIPYWSEQGQVFKWNCPLNF